MSVTWDTSEVDARADDLRKIARDGVFHQGRTGRGRTHAFQAKKFWQLEGKIGAGMLQQSPLGGYEGRAGGKPFDLTDTLSKPTAYTVEPWKNKKGVTVRAGTGKGGKGGAVKKRAAASLYPERAIAPGGSSHPQRKWQIPVKYRLGRGTLPRFAKLYAESLQAEMDYKSSTKGRIL